MKGYRADWKELHKVNRRIEKGMVGEVIKDCKNSVERACVVQAARYRNKKYIGGEWWKGGLLWLLVEKLKKN